MTKQITWNSGIRQELTDIERIAEYELDGKRLMFEPYDKKTRSSSLAVNDIKDVRIITEDDK